MPVLPISKPIMDSAIIDFYKTVNVNISLPFKKKVGLPSFPRKDKSKALPFPPAREEAANRERGPLTSFSVALALRLIK